MLLWSLMEKRVETVLDDNFVSRLWQKWVNTQIDVIIGFLWHAAESLMQQSWCPAVGSVTYTHLQTHNHTQSHQYYMIGGQEPKKLKLCFFSCPCSLFNFCPLVLFFKLYLWSLWSLLESSHLFQFQLNDER